MCSYLYYILNTFIKSKKCSYISKFIFKHTICETEPSPESRYITWLRNCYEEVWKKILTSMEKCRSTTQLQTLTTAIKLLAEEGKAPLEPRDQAGYYFPLHRLKPILMTLLSPEKDNTNLISRFQEIIEYPDALYYTWKCLPSLTPKRQPQEIYIKNLLELVDKIPLPNGEEGTTALLRFILYIVLESYYVKIYIFICNILIEFLLISSLFVKLNS